MVQFLQFYGTFFYRYISSEYYLTKMKTDYCMGNLISRTASPIANQPSSCPQHIITVNRVRMKLSRKLFRAYEKNPICNYRSYFIHNESELSIVYPFRNIYSVSKKFSTCSRSYYFATLVLCAPT